MSDYGRWNSIREDDYKDFDFEAKLAYYKKYDYIKFDLSISNQYSAYVEKATTSGRLAKDYNKTIEDLEETIEETEKKHKIDEKDPGNSDVTYSDVREARKKWKLTMPFTQEAKKAYNEYQKILYRYKVRQPYESGKYEEDLQKKKDKLESVKKKKADAEKDEKDAKDAIKTLVKEMNQQFKELDKIIDLRTAMLKGAKRPNGDGSYSYNKIEYTKPPLDSNLAVSTTFINSTKKIFVSRGKPLTQANMPEIFDSYAKIKTLLTTNQETILNELETTRENDITDYIKKYKEDRTR